MSPHLKELYKKLRKRFLAVNPNPLSTVVTDGDPRFVISRSEVEKLLEITGAEFTYLVRTGVIRKAHVGGVTSLYCRLDVEVLLNTPDSLRQEVETWLRYRNGDAYLDKFSPAHFYDEEGEPYSTEYLSNLETKAALAYTAGVSDNSYIFRKLLAPAGVNQTPTRKLEVEWLYLSEDTTPKLTHALQMRRWYTENTKEVDYRINRITLPPPSAMGKPEHRNVLKFLVQAASDMYGITFDSMDLRSYLEIDEVNNGGAVYDMLTGVEVYDNGEIPKVIDSYRNLGIPKVLNLQLIHILPMWYASYSRLLTRGKFHLGGKVQYLEELANFLLREDPCTDLDLRQIKRLIRQRVGNLATWNRLYTPTTPPLYPGSLPHRKLSTWRKANSRPPIEYLRLHNAVDLDTLPESLIKLYTANRLPKSPEASLQKVVDALTDFHKHIALLLPASNSLGRMKIFAARLMSGLTRRGLNVESVYLYPVRDAKELHHQLFAEGEDKLDNLILEVNDLLPTQKEQI